MRVRTSSVKRGLTDVLLKSKSIRLIKQVELIDNYQFTVNSTGYSAETEKIPVIDARVGWNSEYGTVESHGGKHFVFLNSIIVDNYCEGDVLSTLIHEILHIIHPNDSEENVEEMTKTVCEHFNIKPEKNSASSNTEKRGKWRGTSSHEF